MRNAESDQACREARRDLVELDLAPGTYFAACFVPDKQTGVPHVVMGMVALVTAGTGAASSVATPVAGGAAGGTATAVTMKDFAFTPATVTVPAGGA